MSYVITITKELTDAVLADILSTAYEGGIGYWAQSRNVVRTEGEDWHYVSMELLEEDDGEWDWDSELARPLKLNYGAVAKGIVRIMSGKIKLRSDLLQQVQSALTDNPDIDSEAADCIVQAGLLGEIRYG